VKLRLTITTSLLTALALCVALPAAAMDGSAEAPFRFFTVQDGLTQSEVLDIEQDLAGYLWFTTARGLNRYDGKDFDQYTIADGLPTNSLTALYVSDVNSVWVGDARGGITAIHGARVVHTINAPLEDSGKVLDIEFFSGRRFAVHENVGIVEITDENREFGTRALIADKSLGITNLEVYGDSIWVESATGLYSLNVAAEPRLELLSASILRIHVDSSGTLWVADNMGKLGVWRDGALEPLAVIDSDNEIVGITTDHDGLVWVATSEELFGFDSRGQAPELHGAPVSQYSGIEDVTGLFVDKENSLWLSSGSRLIRFLGDRFEHFRLRTDMDSETVWAISEDRHGRFWFGTHSKLLMRDHDGSLQVIAGKQGIPEGTVRDIVADSSGDLWLGITEHGLFHLDVDSMSAMHVKQSGTANILDISIAHDGAVWYSTIDTGVYRFEPKRQRVTRFAAPEDTSVYTLDTWADGSVWYAADEVGLVRLTENDAGAYDSELITANDELSTRLFDHLRVTGPDSAWIAADEGGLFEYRAGGLVDFGTATPLADQTVYLVEPLGNGTIVVGGEQGLYQFAPGVAGIAHYNQQFGFIGLETNVHSTFFDSEGYLWIGTVDGATRMDVSQPMPRAYEPTPTVVRIETELDGRQVLDNGKIPPDQLGAHIEYAAISLISPRAIQYSYKLVGIDSDWGSPTSNRAVSYPRVPPGEYEFQVRARYPGGEWGQQIASQRFTVLPFFWQQPWFLFAVLIAVLAAIRLLMVYRTRNMEWLNATLRAQVEERTESIEKARQELQISHEQLSKEMHARAELETRFLKAFENAPIGMGLLDEDGILFDANPALKNMFWPALLNRRFADTVSDDDKERFLESYEAITTSKTETVQEKAVCIGDVGQELQTIINISAVRSDRGRFLYSVLQVQDITESMQLTVQLEYQASYDELTGLLNRRAFEAQLEKAWEAGSQSQKNSYLMFMDLDQFKVVNDTSGHTAGDQLLRDVSDILRDSVRGDDVVGRLGGDEFGIILWECPTDVARRIAESIRKSIENYRFHWDVETYRIGVSIGGLPIDPEAGDISELQQLADAACYAAKEAGRNRVHMVSGDQDSARVHRGQVRWVQRLREAMNMNRFAIYGQPIVPLDADSGERERLEILLRLRDPETRKLIPPGAFLPAAERYGLAIELDKWVVHSLLHMLFVHHAFEAVHRSYWINLSGSSVGDRRFADFLVDAVQRSPLPRGTINFEITESAAIRNIAEANELMTKLREMGCRFALDNFGAGVSSFGNLKKLPVDYLKINGMFVKGVLNDETDRIFVKSIIDIAHTLNIKAIAEFVEDEETLAVVRDLGVDYVQGFSVGKPFVLAPRFPKIADSETQSANVQLQAG
jgi:diguanylate cyclase (GGDEF)-like protein/PAS domain S-box-containing protein